MTFLNEPIVMVGVGARPSLSEIVGELRDLYPWFKSVPDKSLDFTAAAVRSIQFKSYYQVGGYEFFTGYWDVVKNSTTTNLARANPPSAPRRIRSG